MVIETHAEREESEYGYTINGLPISTPFFCYRSGAKEYQSHPLPLTNGPLANDQGTMLDLRKKSCALRLLVW